MARDLSTFFRTWAQSVEVKAIQLRRSVAEVLELWSAGSAGLPMVTWNGITYIYGLHIWITYGLHVDYIYGWLFIQPGYSPGFLFWSWDDPDPGSHLERGVQPRLQSVWALFRQPRQGKQGSSTRKHTYQIHRNHYKSYQIMIFMWISIL